MTALEVFEARFSEVDLGALAKRRPTTIYALVDGAEVVYIGRTECLGQRMALHATAGGKRFDRAFAVEVDEADGADMEGALIRTLAPRYNRSCPKDRGLDAQMLGRFGMVVDEAAKARFLSMVREKWLESHRLRKERERAESAELVAEEEWDARRHPHERPVCW